MKNSSLGSLLIAGLLLSACGGKPAEQAQQQAPQAMPFPTVKAELRDMMTYNQFPATMSGTTTNDVRAKVSGYIQKVLVDEGQRVKKGQTLFQLETRTLSQDAGAAQARVQVAQVEVDKLTPLVAKGIIGNAQLESAKANLAQAKSALSSISANIGYAAIKSPIDGVAGKIPFREGTLVSPSDPTPLTTVADINTVNAYFAMNEKDYLAFSRTTIGKTQNDKAKSLPAVSLILADGSTYEEKGKVNAVTGHIDPQTGTINFRAIFKNPHHLLRNGSSGTILVPELFNKATVLPALSAFEQQGRKYIFVVKGDSLVQTTVTVLSTIDNLILVEGIAPDEQVLAQGSGKARSGMKIVPQLTTVDSVVNSFQKTFK